MTAFAPDESSTQPSPSGPRIRTEGEHRPGFVVRTLAATTGKMAGTEPSRVFLTLGRHRKLFWGWLKFAGALMPGGRLPRRHTEMVIVRIAAHNDSAYELQAHRRLAKETGLTDADLARLEDVTTLEGWEGADLLVLQVADELHHTRDLTDATWARLREHLDEPLAIELVMLVGHYEMLATTLRTLRVEPDPEL